MHLSEIVGGSSLGPTTNCARGFVFGLGWSCLEQSPRSTRSHPSNSLAAGRPDIDATFVELLPSPTSEPVASRAGQNLSDPQLRRSSPLNDPCSLTRRPVFASPTATYVSRHSALPLNPGGVSTSVSTGTTLLQIWHSGASHPRLHTALHVIDIVD